MEHSEDKPLALPGEDQPGVAEEPENVIRVNFGAPRAPKTPGERDEPAAPAPQYPYDVEAFEPDPLALKKLGVFKAYIEQGMVSVTLDPKRAGVSVPQHFVDRPELVLNFSHRFFIDDFTFNEHAVSASLSFSGRPFLCVVPWGAVKMLLSHYDNAVSVFDAEMLS